MPDPVIEVRASRDERRSARRWPVRRRAARSALRRCRTRTRAPRWRRSATAVRVRRGSAWHASVIRETAALAGARSIREALCGHFIESCHSVLCFVILLARCCRAQTDRHAVRPRRRRERRPSCPGSRFTARHVGHGSRSARRPPTRRAATRWRRCRPGAYEIRAELAGFRPLVRQGVTLTIGQTAVVDLTLEVGGVERSGRRSSRQASPVNTRTGELSYLVESARHRRAAAERPQLHRSRAAAARRRRLSASRRRFGGRARPRDERQRTGSARRTSICSTARCSTT